MQSAPLLPRTAPFAEEQIAALNSVISVTTAEQRAWLSGYLAGLQATNDPQAAVPPRRRPSACLTILFGTESGNGGSGGPSSEAAAKLGLHRKWSIWRLHARPGGRHGKFADRRLPWGDPPLTRHRLFDQLMTDDAPASTRPALPCWPWATGLCAVL
jgi:sulfite reductase (NADPH) flavoprotein alpha-component